MFSTSKTIVTQAQTNSRGMTKGAELVDIHVYQRDAEPVLLGNIPRALRDDGPLCETCLDLIDLRGFSQAASWSGRCHENRRFRHLGL